MCGITGWIDLDRDLTRSGDVVAAMGRTLAHRGPDAEGVWLSPRAALAHRRLAVIDPEGGEQPMVRRVGDAQVVITYNGELYNTDPLRRALEERGHRFCTRSDTEVLLVAYIEWGDSCLDRLEGIFALGIWDERCGEIFLARDRLGVKPLFYAHRGRGLVFGSELKALLAHPEVEPRVEADGLAEVFLMGPGRTPGHGVYAGVRELRAGEWLRFGAQGLKVRRYWALESHEHEDDAVRTRERVGELFAGAVERQLVADVPVCTLLSGGLDSSAVSAVAARVLSRAGRRLVTFSVDFVDMERYFRANAFQTSLDGPWAARVARHLGTCHHRVVLDAGALVSHLTEPLRQRDLPGMADIDTSLMLLCERIKAKATVALSGESADELFGGYPWFHDEELLARPTFPWSANLAARLDVLSPELIALTGGSAYIEARYEEALAEVPRLPGETGRAARIREVGYLNLTRFLQTLLERKDRMSMKSGLEVRVPFCDHGLVAYVWNIPWSLKTAGGESKGILRQALAGLLPEDVIHRRKTPYPSPQHPRYVAAVRSWLLEILDDPASPVLPFVNAERLRAIARESLGPMSHRPWFGQIMGVAQMFDYLIQTNTWLATYRVRVA